MSEKQQQINLMDPGSPTIGYKLTLRGGDLFTVSQKDLEIFRQAYRGVDIEKELSAMVAWCYANDSKRKTKRGIMRFINNWLSSAASALDYSTSHKVRLQRAMTTSTRDTSLTDDLTNKEWAQ